MATLDRENNAESGTGDDGPQSTVTADDAPQDKYPGEQAPATQEGAAQAGARHAGGVGVPDAPADADFAVMGEASEYVPAEDDLPLDDEDDEDKTAELGDLDEFAIASGDEPAPGPGTVSEAGYGFNSGQPFGGHGEAQALAQGFDGTSDLLANTQATGTAFVAPQQFGEFTLRSTGDLGGVQ